MNLSLQTPGGACSYGGSLGVGSVCVVSAQVWEYCFFYLEVFNSWFESQPHGGQVEKRC